MPKVKLTAVFKFSPDGIRVIEYPAGEHDLEGRALEVAESLGLVAGRKAGGKRGASQPEGEGDAQQADTAAAEQSADPAESEA